MIDANTPPNKIPWPPILYLTAIGSAYFIGTTWGALWYSNNSSTLIMLIGATLAACGLVLDIYSLLTLRNNNTTVMANKAASNLVTTGPFSFSRNPIYLGNTIITVGLALAFHSFWFLLLGLLAAFITNEMVIKREEQHLLNVFGEKWEAYRKKVRRWL